MGGLAVLYPQDCLRDRHKFLINSQKKPCRNPNPTRSNRRKRSPEKSNSNSNSSGKNKSRQTMADSVPSKNLVMGQVKILKRGEELTVLKDRESGVEEKPPEKKAGDLDDMLSSTGRLGPEPEMVPKQMRLGDFYAGSAFIESPPPSSLPLPAFFAKKSLLSNKDGATSDLLRLLRLDLP